MSTYDKVVEMLKEELGDITDGYIVMDVLQGCVEPGYHYDDDTVIVLGNWNPKRWVREGEPPLTDEENLPVTLGNKLDEMEDVEIEWEDEWTRCGECYRAFRTQPNSYSWTMYGAFVESACEYICAECLNANVEAYLDDYIDNPDNAVVWCDDSTLIENGWEQWNGQFENGFHPGQNDDPHKILKEIKEENEDLQVVFLIDSVGQFDMRFSAWVRQFP